MTGCTNTRETKEFTMLEKHGATTSEARVLGGDRGNASQKAWIVAQAVLFGTVIAQFILMYRGYGSYASCISPPSSEDHGSHHHVSKHIPDYYQTSPELFPGMYAVTNLGHRELTLARSNSYRLTWVSCRNEASLYWDCEYCSWKTSSFSTNRGQRPSYRTLH